MPDWTWTTDLRRRLAPLRLVSPAREAEIVEELSQHLDQRYEELRAARRQPTPTRARLRSRSCCEPEALARYMRPLRQANVPAADRRSERRARSWRGRSVAGSALRRADAAPAAGLRRGGHPDAGARHRRQQRDLRAGRRDAAAPAAVPEPGAPGDGLGAHGDLRPGTRRAAEPARLERSGAARSRRSRLHPRRRRHGDERRRRHRRNRAAPVGHRRLLRRARRRADCRPHVPALGRSPAAPTSSC